ncbi:hypothetical protein [Falsiruegeria mediterranea]|uniref:Uncharacterized protein n=1 Tax=Falsiruegeria mediterranea M17 TaxID=1200281 RepID=A0A2R8C5J9_9RHOB|nr:hypothetical protein [Falsiruegeria mediterranea]SPJ27636.1 hypothetical protein TRM7615_01126 [Falsiruegeria mediterranea M17]
MDNGCLDLTSSAFHILKAGYDADRSDIADLVEDAEFDEVFEPQKIQRAQQSLLAPNARLEQEISWLPELSQAQTSNVLSLVASSDLEALIETSKHAPELAKANILAHFAGSGNVNENLFHALVAAWDEIDEATILIFINENRQRAGFPRVEPEQLHNVLMELEKKHARSAAVGIWSLDRPGAAMDRIVEAELRRRPSSSFLEQFVRSYDTLSEPDLVCISDEIDEVISDAENTDADLAALVTRASDLLVRWDDVNQPVQVYEQHQGHEEGRSKRIYEKLRSLCLDLANNRSEFTEARRLSEALLRTFPELESVAEVLKGDVAALENLDEQQKLHEEYKPLIDACEAAKTKLPTPISTVLKIFKDTVSKGEDEPIAFNILRDLALHINNDCNDPQTAFKLLDGALTFAGARPPQELKKTLEEERAVLHRNWKMNELEKNSGNLTAMSQTVEDLLKYARGSERAELQQLKTKLDRKRLGKKVKWGIYASIAAAIGFFVIADEMDRPSNRSTYQPSAPRVATPTPKPAPATSAAVETIPPVGQGLTLNRSQIRYCVFQGQRLDIIRTLTTTDYQIDRFNALIGDFNSRCSSFRYRSGDLSAAEREARENAADLRADARRIVSSW